MSGDIYLNESGELKWWGSTGVYFWVVRLLAEKVIDQEGAAALELLDRENLKWLHVHEFLPRGRREILEVLGHGELMRQAEESLPESKEREVVLNSLARLADLARQAEV